MAKGERVVLEDVHDAWAAWMSEQDQKHQSLKPLCELPRRFSVQTSATWMLSARLHGIAVSDAERVTHRPCGRRTSP